MPKVTAKVLAVKDDNGTRLAKIQLDGNLPPVGASVSVKWGSVRSMPQNALYWTYLTWLIDVAGLKDHGHFFPESLHENLKKHLLAEASKDLEATTTDLSKSEFSLYFEKVDKFIQEFFEIDTAPFWQEHQERFAA